LWDDTNPREKGEDLHVLDLLQRLEKDSEPGVRGVNPPPRQQPTKWAQWDPEIPCGSCHYLNPADQKFCGYCGTPLARTSAPQRPYAPPPRTEERRREVPPEPPRFASEERQPSPEPPPLIFEERDASPEPPPFVFEERGFEERNPGPEPAPPFAYEERRAYEAPLVSSTTPQSRERDESDLEFLRYKTQGAEESSSGWRFPVAVAVLAIAGFVGYRVYNGMSIVPQQLTRRPANTSASSPSSAPETSSTVAEPDVSADQPVQEAPPASAKTTPPASAANRSDSDTPAVSKSAKPATPVREEQQNQVTEASQRSPERVSAPPTPSIAASAGNEELNQARRYLSPETHNTTEAARWLWKAVGKENGQAVLLLSDLYARGDGVVKSCDQARLLLTVAAKKGNVDAASRLRSLDAAGCQ
jgi:hypothetical protein